MRLRIVKTKNTTQYAIIQDINKNGKRTTKIYENLGNIDKIKQKCGNDEPLKWVENYVKELNKKVKENSIPILLRKYESRQIEKDKQRIFNCGYLFLEKIYYNLRFDEICDTITNKYSFKFDFNSILSSLLFARIIYPSSKLKTLELSKNFLEQPNFSYINILRALEIICKESDFIQSQLYKNSAKYMKRNNKVLYYDCTNFFFEIEQEDDLRKYGKGKENRPNPIVQMGLFMDGDGIPLSFTITPGNKNEQKTLIPLEEKIVKDFETAEFVVCTDAGLSSNENRKFNNKSNRKFITTQSIKKLKEHLQEEVLDLTKGWKIKGSDKLYNISDLRKNEELIKKYKNEVFYKERYINENGLEQRLIVTYSVKYQEYQRTIRNRQIERAKKIISNNPEKFGKCKGTDPKRFIKTTAITKEGEKAEINKYWLDQSVIDEESKYDGLYAVCTNLEDSVEEIIRVNHRRWEIEESFRIMKSEFDARPVHLSREDRITAHFAICFLALVIYRYLEKETDSKYTTCQLIETLRNMNFIYEKPDLYLPAYTRTDITDLLHDKFGFRTDFEAISEKSIKKILKDIKR